MDRREEGGGRERERGRVGEWERGRGGEGKGGGEKDREGGREPVSTHVSAGGPYFYKAQRHVPISIYLRLYPTVFSMITHHSSIGKACTQSGF